MNKFYQEAKARSQQITVRLLYVVTGKDATTVLLLERAANQNLPGQYEFPGGRLESNETLLQGVVREVWEETGISLVGEKIKFLDYLDFTTTDGKQVREFFFLYCADKLPVKTHPQEHIDSYWVRWESLLDKPLHPEIKKFFNERRAWIYQKIRQG